MRCPGRAFLMGRSACKSLICRQNMFFWIFWLLFVFSSALEDGDVWECGVGQVPFSGPVRQLVPFRGTNSNYHSPSVIAVIDSMGRFRIEGYGEQGKNELANDAPVLQPGVNEVHYSSPTIATQLDYLLDEAPVEVSCGGKRCHMITVNGSVLTWGGEYPSKTNHAAPWDVVNPPRQEALPASLPASTCDCRNHLSACVLANGSIAIWGVEYKKYGGMYDSETKIPSPVIHPFQPFYEKFAYVRLHDEYGMAVTTQGSLYVWGWQSYFRLGDIYSMSSNTYYGPNFGGYPPTLVPLQNVSQVCLDDQHACAIAGVSRQVYCWGRNIHGILGVSGLPDPYYKEPQLVKNLTDVETITCKRFRNAATTRSGDLYVWGVTDNSCSSGISYEPKLATVPSQVAVKSVSINSESLNAMLLLGCPPGTSRNATNDRCESCQQGYFSETGRDCVPCRPGYHAAMARSISCSLCASGQYADHSGLRECKGCPPGSYTPPGSPSSQCLPCSRGFYAPLSQTSACIECDPGSYQNNTGSTVCQPCSKGSFSAMAGQGECDPCPPGTELRVAGSSQESACSPCVAGTYASSNGTIGCTDCPENTYQDRPGQASCMPCPANTRTGTRTNSIDLCVCGTNNYGGVRGLLPCRPCPANSLCPLESNDHPVPAQGFWISARSLDMVYRCSPQSSCPGEALDACSKGYTGTGCSACDEGYFRSGGQCRECTTSSKRPVVVVVVASLGVLVFAVCACCGFGCPIICREATTRALGTPVRRKRLSGIQMNEKVAVVLPNTPDYGALSWRPLNTVIRTIRFMQLISLVSGVMVPWPSSLGRFMSVSGYVALDISVLFQFPCYLGNGVSPVLVELYTMLLIPVVMEGLLWGCLMISLGIQAVERLWRVGSLSLASKKGVRMRTAIDDLVKHSVTVVTVFYISIHVTCVKVFTCFEQTPGSHFLVADPEVRCFVAKGDWVYLLPGATVGLAVFSFGVPLLFSVLLAAQHRRSKRDPRVRARYGFMWNAFRPGWYYWEAFSLVFRMLLVLTMPLSALGPSDQMMYLCLLMFFYTVIFTRTMPMAARRDNVAEFVVLLAVVVTIQVGLLTDVLTVRSSQASQDTIVGVGIIFHVVAWLFLAAFTVWDWVLVALLPWHKGRALLRKCKARRLAVRPTPGPSDSYTVDGVFNEKPWAEIGHLGYSESGFTFLEKKPVHVKWCNGVGACPNPFEETLPKPMLPLPLKASTVVEDEVVSFEGSDLFSDETTTADPTCDENGGQRHRAPKQVWVTTHVEMPHHPQPPPPPPRVSGNTDKSPLPGGLGTAGEERAASVKDLPPPRKPPPPPPPKRPNNVLMD